MPLILFGVWVVVTILAGIFLFRRASIEGKFILFFAVLALGAYFRLHFYLLLLVSLTLFGFVGVALGWAIIAISGVRLSRLVKDEAMVGENLPIKYKINTKSQLALYHTRIWDRASRDRTESRIDELSFEKPGYLGFLRFQRKEPVEGILHFMPSVRGLVRFGPVAVEGGDPMGIFSLIKWLPISNECLVLPARVRMNSIPPIPARLGTREQEHLISREGHSHEFLGIRPYSDGDSLRGVHWPLTARHNALIVRQFQKEVEEEVLIILDADVRGNVGEGAENAFEYMITLALSIANAAYEMGRPWNLVIATHETNHISHTTKEPMLLAQYTLARLKADRSDPVENHLETIRRQYRNAACILITPRTDPGPSVSLQRGDSMLGVGIHSVLIKVDPNSFATSIDEGIKAFRQRRKTSETSPVMSTESPIHIPEFTVVRGDNIADLFLGSVIA